MTGYIIIFLTSFIFGGCLGFFMVALLSAAKTVEEIDRIMEDTRNE